MGGCMRVKKIKNQLLVIAAKWFDKVNGNTYHSVKVLVDNVQIGKVTYVYGYGEQYWQTAKEILQRAGYIANTGEKLPYGGDKDIYEFEMWLREEKNRSKVIKIVNNVPRKRDLVNF